jgi:hypothetical protein
LKSTSSSLYRKGTSISSSWEELSVSIQFQEWFASRIYGEPIFRSRQGAWHSVDHAKLGETDLLFVFESTEDSRVAILIENKIDAPPQPKQGERYRLRGEAGQKEGFWDTYRTCVIAPSKYLSSTKHTESYDTEISYEEIFAFFQSRSSTDPRFQYKAGIVIEGIQKNRRGYQPEYDEVLTQFVADYHAFADSLHPELQTQKPKPRPSGSNWITFHPDSLPKNVDLIHQMTAGFIKAFFYAESTDFDSIKEFWASLVPEEAIIDNAAKSVTISIPVGKLDPFKKEFEEQSESVRQSLDKAVLLNSLIEANHTQMNREK